MILEIIHIIISKIINATDVRFNDGKCDKNGILHIGTMCRSKPRNQIGNI